MASKTTNFNLTKPSADDFYDIGVHNDNMDIIDAEMKRMDDESKRIDNDAKENLEEHTNAPNPHNITASTVGLGNVPNVATNDQTPTYTEASTLTNLASGEKLSVALGKIKKAITSFVSHLADNVMHVTSTERTTWNAKAPTSHASANTTYGVGTGSNYGHLKITDSKTSTATDTAASAKALKEVNDKVVEQGFELIKTQDISFSRLMTSSSLGIEEATPITGVNVSNYKALVFEFVGTLSIEDVANKTTTYPERFVAVRLETKGYEDGELADTRSYDIATMSNYFNSYYGKLTAQMSSRMRFSVDINPYYYRLQSSSETDCDYRGLFFEEQGIFIHGNTFDFTIAIRTKQNSGAEHATGIVNGVLNIYGKRGL